MKEAGIVDKVKLVTIPKGRNKILVRIENLADHYDEDSTTQQVNMKTLVEGMWKSAHDIDSEVAKYTLVETSVTGN